ncbi:hypothetical protein [Tsukamurella pseudospumae]|nr:hypothetical protein [Tsukamurella pseudospumae]
MLRRIKVPQVPLAEVMFHVHALQELRRRLLISGRVDERVGKPLDRRERTVVDTLVAEGRNVTVLARARTGDSTPDIAVDGRAAEIKSSTRGNARAFAFRVGEVWDRQGTGLVFVNADESAIDHADLVGAMQALVAHGDAAYIRVIGRRADIELGRWP